MANWASDLIANILDENEIDRNAVSNNLRYQTVHGKGFCYCEKCKNSWSSHWIWIKIDLKKAKIDYRFKQKCIKCKNIFRPTVLAKSLEEMMEIVIKRYRALISGDGRKSVNSPPKRGQKKPHQSDLCEKCGYGVRCCWLPYRDEE